MKLSANFLSETNYIMIPEGLGAKYVYLSICKQLNTRELF